MNTPTRHADLSEAFDIDMQSDELYEAVRNGVSNGRLPSEIRLDPETVERDLVKLVLTLVEFVRQLMEAQAVRRMENGTLTDEQEEKLGDTLWKARQKIVELAEELDIDPQTLTLDLGPLGRLV